MKINLIMLLILMIFISLLTGCWNSREINELAIATAIGIDKSEEGYLITVQLINPGEIASQRVSTRTSVSTYRISGETVFEALRRLTLITPRKVYLSHMRLLVFGENFAKEGIAKALDFFSRDHGVRTDFYIVVANGTTAEAILHILTPVEQIPANKIFYSLQMSAKAWASAYTVQLDELISTLVDEGINPVLTGIIVKGNSKLGMDVRNVEKVDVPATLQINSLAGFKNDKLIGWLNEEESIGYNYIMDHVTSTIVNVPYSKDEKISIELINSKSKVKAKVEHGEYKIDIEVLAEGNVGDVECKIDLSETENIYELETKVEEIVKKQMATAIKKAQKDFKSDIFGFGESIHRTNPKLWKELKKDWDKEFENLEVNIKVITKLRRLGSITKSFQNM